MEQYDRSAPRSSKIWKASINSRIQTSVLWCRLEFFQCQSKSFWQTYEFTKIYASERNSFRGHHLCCYFLGSSWWCATRICWHPVSYPRWTWINVQKRSWYMPCWRVRKSPIWFGCQNCWPYQLLQSWLGRVCWLRFLGRQNMVKGSTKRKRKTYHLLW